MSTLIIMDCFDWISFQKLRTSVSPNEFFLEHVKRRKEAADVLDMASQAVIT
jgi:hypothetical protein